MDIGLILLPAFLAILLFPITIWRINKSQHRRQIAITHLLIFIVYGVIILFSVDNESALLPLPQKPIKLGTCMVAHIWLAFFHATTIRIKADNFSPTNKEPAGEIDENNSSKTTIPRTVIILATLICINPFWAIVGLPLYLLGIIVLLMTSVDRIYKVKWTVIPISCVIILYASVMAVHYIFQG